MRQRRILGLLAAVGFACSTHVMLRGQGSVGQNINIITGSDDQFVGDMYRQRQNEAAIGISSVNPAHMMAAYNDYRTVDFAGDLGVGTDAPIFQRFVSAVREFFRGLWKPERREEFEDNEAAEKAAAQAWIGLSFSDSGGSSWYSGLHPGYPGDPSEAGARSGLSGFEAASDPVMASSHNQFFVGGIAFNVDGQSAGFVSRFTDTNSTDTGRNIQYDFTRPILTVGKDFFVDKPSIAVGANGRVYAAFVQFDERDTRRLSSKITVFRSLNAGESWSSGVTISEPLTRNQAPWIVVDPNNPNVVYVGWRVFSTRAGGFANAIVGKKSTNGGLTFGPAIIPYPVALGLKAFDQPQLRLPTPTPRSTAYPTAAIDGNGAIHVALQEYVNPTTGVPLGPLAGVTSGVPRVTVTSSYNGGLTWTARRAVDLAGAGTQFMPVLTAVGEPGPSCPGRSGPRSRVMLMFFDARAGNVGRTAGGTGYVTGGGKQFDVRIAEASACNRDSAGRLIFAASQQMSRYTLSATPTPGAVPPRHDIVKIPDYGGLYTAVNRAYPMFCGGTCAFTGDYIHLTPRVPYVRTAAGEWKLTTAMGIDPATLPAPVVRGVWPDTRDVRLPTAPGPTVGNPGEADFIDGLAWWNYQPPHSGATPPPCFNPGSRDQNVYSAEYAPGGLFAAAPQTFKPSNIPHAYPIYVENRGAQPKLMKLTIDVGAFASFDHRSFDLPNAPPLDKDADIALAPYSTVTGSVIIGAGQQDPVLVTIQEIDGDGNVLAAGVRTSVTLFTAGESAATTTETHAPQVISETPRVSKPFPAGTFPAFVSPQSPFSQNPFSQNPFSQNPFSQNPFSQNPFAQNPFSQNPFTQNPFAQNAAQGTIYDATDYTFVVANAGTDTAAFSALLNIQNALRLKGSYLFQVLINRSSADLGLEGCQSFDSAKNVQVSSIITPFAQNPFSQNPFSQNPFSQNPFSQNPFSQNPFSQNPFSQNPFSQNTSPDDPEFVTPSHPSISNSSFYLAPASSLAGAASAAAALGGVPEPNPQLNLGTYTLRAYQIRGSDDPAFVPLAPEGGVPQIAVTVTAATPDVIETAPGVSRFDPQGPPTSSGGAAVAVKLAFVTQPTSTTPGSTLTPPVQVVVQDGFGTVITEPARMVTMAIGNNAGGGTLLGTLRVQAVNGIATFPDLAITSAGSGYTLLATSSGLTSATSPAFDISSTSGADLTPEPGLAAVSWVQMPDAPGNVEINPVTGIAYVIAHTFGGPNPRVIAVNTATNAIVAQYPVGPNPSAVAVNPVTDRVYVTSRSDNPAIWEIDVPAGQVNLVLLPPFHNMTLGIDVDSARNRIYVTHDGGGVTAIDGATRTELHYIPGIGALGGVRVNPVTNKIYVSNNASVSVIDGETWSVLDVPLADNPGALAINVKTNRIYAVSQQFGQQKIHRISGALDAVDGVGFANVNAGIAVDEDRNLVYATNSGNSTLIVLDGATLGIITQAVAAPGNSSLTVDPRNGRIYTQDLSLGAMVTIAPPLSLPAVHAAPGATVTIRGLVARNLGGSPSAPTGIKFTLSSIGSPGVSQILTTSVPSLSPMEGRLIEPSLPISPSLPPGDYALSVEIDYSDIIPESNELNNVVEIPVRIRSAAQPDLVVTSLTHMPASPSVGETVTATVVVSNVGDGMAPESQMRLTLKDDETFQSSAPLVLVNVPPLAPGTAFSFTRSLIAVTPGAVTHVANVDYTGVMSESSEANNRTENTFLVASDGFLVVRNTNDTGPDSLRQAILDANATPGRQMVTFAIVDLGSSVKTISPLSPLPVITDGVVIDATTQPGYVTGSPVVHISGVSAGGAANGLTVQTSRVTIRGLAITSFAQSGVFVGGPSSGNVLESNVIGLAPDGVTASGNNEGVTIAVSSNNTVGGLSPAMRNVISGNLAAGVNLSTGAHGNVILGNYIGTNAGGTAAVGNPVGVTVTSNAASNVIGLSTSGFNVISGTRRNVISGNTVGIRVQSTGSGNRVHGNHIGTDVTGSVALGNTEHGVVIRDSSGTIVGSTVPAESGGNLISGNGTGVQVDGSTSNGNLLQGNRIGVNATSSAALPNNGSGVVVSGAANTRVSVNVISGNAENGVWVLGSAFGTTIQRNIIGTNLNSAIGLGNGLDGILLHAPAVIIPLPATSIEGTPVLLPNVISGNAQNGIRIIATGGVSVLGSLIGTNVQGTNGVGNGEWGIRLDTGAHDNFISGLDDGERQNTIAFNAEGGIGVSADAGDGNSLSVNRIHSNGGLAIDLGRDGVTFNDNLDVDAGPNERQNFPVITGASSTGAITTVTGGLHSRPNSAFRIDFFVNSQCDPSGFGEAQSWLGSITQSTDMAGDLTFNEVFDTASGGTFVTATATATATQTSNSSSEASACRLVIGPPAAPIGVINTNNSGDGSLRQAILNANAALGLDTITFNIPGPGPHTIPVTSTALPVITDPVFIDAASQPGYSGSPLIILDGSGAGPGDGLAIAGGNSHVRGLSIVGFNGSAIALNGSAFSTIQANYLGILPDGTTAKANDDGVSILNSSNNTIGGTTPQDRNIISGNSGSGVRIVGETDSNVVQGNYIGTDAAGTAAVPNDGLQSGVFIFNGVYNMIGGTTPGAGNIISGNEQHAVTIAGPAAYENYVQGNYIGVDATGLIELGNGGIGIDIIEAVNTLIGGSGGPPSRNIISGNGTGVQIRTGAAATNVIGNFIGTDVAGIGPIGNQFVGIYINDGVLGGQISGNLIANNGGTGVAIEDTSRSGILNNSFKANGGLGIDLGGDGVAINDPADEDDGPNHFQNYPVIDSVASAGGTTTVTGTLNSTPMTSFTIQLFSSAMCDPSGHGEGETLVGSFNQSTDLGGNLAFNNNFAVSLSSGMAVTATATPTFGSDTSEFSACRLVP